MSDTIREMQARVDEMTEQQAARPEPRIEAGAAMQRALREADEAASVAHDYIWPQSSGQVTQQEASDAIWRIHELLRPLITTAPQAGDYPEEGTVPTAVQNAWNEAATPQEIEAVRENAIIAERERIAARIQTMEPLFGDDPDRATLFDAVMDVLRDAP